MAQVGRVLDGKIAIITGGSRGIGAAIATNLAAKGVNLVLNYTSASSGELAAKLADELTSKYSIRVVTVKADVSTKEGAQEIVAKAKEFFGADFKVDIVVNNAGISINTELADISIEEFESQYKVNVLGPILLMQAVLPYLPHDRSGRIVNISSISATAGFVGQTIYGGTKAAVDAMTRTWARELAERATVNSINPGPVLTDMWAGTTKEFKQALSPFVKAGPLHAVRPGIDSQELVDDAVNAGGRPAYVEEIAGIVGMLCTSDSGFCTGQVVCANGGMRFIV